MITCKTVPYGVLVVIVDLFNHFFETLIWGKFHLTCGPFDIGESQIEMLELTLLSIDYLVSIMQGGNVIDTARFFCGLFGAEEKIKK
jgi:hypothetical protein